MERRDERGSLVVDRFNEERDSRRRKKRKGRFKMGRELQTRVRLRRSIRVSSEREVRDYKVKVNMVNMSSTKVLFQTGSTSGVLFSSVVDDVRIMYTVTIIPKDMYMVHNTICDI